MGVTLTPNPKFYGPKAKSKVVFKFLADTAAEFQAFQAGEVSAIYPQPQLDAIDAINAGLTGADKYVTANTGNVEALWLNNAAFPFDSLAVRQAFAYAVDRDAIVKRLFGGIGVNKAVNSLNPPILANYSDQSAFSKYKLNLKMVSKLMTGDGWKKNSSGFWEKGGKASDLEIKSTTGNKRRELSEQILQAQLAKAGFKLTINNQSAGDLFGKQLPAGDYQLALYAQVATSLEPGLCAIMCSKNIPTAANNNTGQNWTRSNVKGLDKPLEVRGQQLERRCPHQGGQDGRQVDGRRSGVSSARPAPQHLAVEQEAQRSEAGRSDPRDVLQPRDVDHEVAELRNIETRGRSRPFRVGTAPRTGSLPLRGCTTGC